MGERPAPWHASGSGESPRSALDHLIGDDGALYLAGALPDPFDPQFAEEPLGRVLAHVTPAAEDLHRAVGDAAGRLGSVQLGHRALSVLHLDVDLRVDAPGSLV